MAQVLRIAIDWRVPPSEIHQRVPVVAPKLTAQPVDACGLYEAVLVPSARFTLLPRLAADELGVDLAGLQRVHDPLFPGFALWHWKTAHPVRVMGRSVSDHLLLNLPIAFDSSPNLSAVVLGERFFSQVRVQLAPDQEDASFIEQMRSLD